MPCTFLFMKTLLLVILHFTCTFFAMAGACVWYWPNNIPLTSLVCRRYNTIVKRVCFHDSYLTLMSALKGNGFLNLHSWLYRRFLPNWICLVLSLSIQWTRESSSLTPTLTTSSASRSATPRPASSDPTRGNGQRLWGSSCSSLHMCSFALGAGPTTARKCCLPDAC